MEANSANAAAGIYREERMPKKRQPDYAQRMLWMNHSGAQWRQMPERYGPWQSVYVRCAKWRDEGIWEKIFSELTKDADTENLSIDSRKSIFAKGIKTSYNRAHR